MWAYSVEYFRLFLNHFKSCWTYVDVFNKLLYCVVVFWYYIYVFVLCLILFTPRTPEIPQHIQWWNIQTKNKLRQSALLRAFSKLTFLDVSTVEFVATYRWFPPPPLSRFLSMGGRRTHRWCMAKIIAMTRALLRVNCLVLMARWMSTIIRLEGKLDIVSCFVRWDKCYNSALKMNIREVIFSKRRWPLAKSLPEDLLGSRKQKNSERWRANGSQL